MALEKKVEVRNAPPKPVILLEAEAEVDGYRLWLKVSLGQEQVLE